MNYPAPHHDPPRPLTERLEQLNQNLQSLGDRLKEAIASAIGTTVAQAVRDAIFALLGQPESAPRYQDRDRYPEERSWRERSWDDPDRDPWMERHYYEPPSRYSGSSRTSPTRLRHALAVAAQSSLYWLGQQRSQRPVLTTSVIALAAGLTAFFYGPSLAAGVGLLASVAGLVLTAESASSAAGKLADLTSS